MYIHVYELSSCNNVGVTYILLYTFALTPKCLVQAVWELIPLCPLYWLMIYFLHMYFVHVFCFVTLFFFSSLPPSLLLIPLLLSPLAGSPSSSPLMGHQRKWRNKHLSSADEYNHYKGSMDSIPNEEDEMSGSATGGSTSSSKDLNKETKVPGFPHPGSQGSDECYADPVDAIHNYLHSGLPGPQQRMGSTEVLDSPNAVFSPVTPTEELHMQQSKEAQLQQFHD